MGPFLHNQKSTISRTSNLVWLEAALQKPPFSNPHTCFGRLKERRSSVNEGTNPNRSAYFAELFGSELTFYLIDKIKQNHVAFRKVIINKRAVSIGIPRISLEKSEKKEVNNNR